MHVVVGHARSMHYRMLYAHATVTPQFSSVVSLRLERENASKKRTLSYSVEQKGTRRKQPEGSRGIDDVSEVVQRTYNRKCTIRRTRW